MWAALSCFGRSRRERDHTKYHSVQDACNAPTGIVSPDTSDEGQPSNELIGRIAQSPDGNTARAATFHKDQVESAFNYQASAHGMRNSVLLENSPLLVTVVGLGSARRHAVIHQNASSKAWLGNLAEPSHRHACNEALGEDPLMRIFAEDTAKLDMIMCELNDNDIGNWKGILRVARPCTQTAGAPQASASAGSSSFAVPRQHNPMTTARSAPAASGVAFSSNAQTDAPRPEAESSFSRAFLAPPDGGQTGTALSSRTISEEVAGRPKRDFWTIQGGAVYHSAAASMGAAGSGSYPCNGAAPRSHGDRTCSTADHRPPSENPNVRKSLSLTDMAPAAVVISSGGVPFSCSAGACRGSHATAAPHGSQPVASAATSVHSGPDSLPAAAADSDTPVGQGHSHGSRGISVLVSNSRAFPPPEGSCVSFAGATAVPAASSMKRRSMQDMRATSPVLGSGAVVSGPGGRRSAVYDALRTSTFGLGLVECPTHSGSMLSSANDVTMRTDPFRAMSSHRQLDHSLTSTLSVTRSATSFTSRAISFAASLRTAPVVEAVSHTTGSSPPTAMRAGCNDLLNEARNSVVTSGSAGEQVSGPTNSRTVSRVLTPSAKRPDATGSASADTGCTLRGIAPLLTSSATDHMRASQSEETAGTSTESRSQEGAPEAGSYGSDEASSDAQLLGNVDAVAAVASAAFAEWWHEVWATRSTDPITGESIIVFVQHDITAKVVMERHLALVMETGHRLLEQIFPRHVLKHITEGTTASAAAAAAGGAQRTAPDAPDSNMSPQLQLGVSDCNALATWHPLVTLLFADIEGFTPMCKDVEPRIVMSTLNDLFSRFDALLDKFGVFKVETIGDCYFVAGGLIHEDDDGMAVVRDENSREDPLHAEKVFMFAKAMLAVSREVMLPTTGKPVSIRIGLHTGPVVSGVVGTRMPRFCLFGDTVNTTSRMESTGIAGAIHVSEATYNLLKGESWTPTGGLEVKGKGLMQTYIWHPHSAYVLGETTTRGSKEKPGSASELAKFMSLRQLALAATASRGSVAGFHPGHLLGSHFTLNDGLDASDLLSLEGDIISMLLGACDRSPAKLQ